jgi:hypothetical protein
MHSEEITDLLSAAQMGQTDSKHVASFSGTKNGG